MSEEFGIFKRLLESAVKNIAQSYYDDFSKKNASFRSASGLGAKVIRRDDGKCCEWCSDLSGTYDYNDRPDEIFRRHRNCTCTVVVKYTKDGKTRYTDVYDKKDYASEKEARIAQAKKMEELDKLSDHEKMERRARLDAEYSRNYRKGMTKAQKEAELQRKRAEYHAKNPDSKYLTGGKYEGRDPLNSPATLNGKTGKELEDLIKNRQIEEELIEKFSKIANEEKVKVNTYATRKSRWNGKIIIDDSLLEYNVVGIADWDDNIILTSEAKKGDVIHELFHTCSAMHDGEAAFDRWEAIEEGTVDYITRLYCEKEHIPYRGAYDDIVDLIRPCYNYSGYEDELEFATDLFNQPLNKRLDWLHDKVETQIVLTSTDFNVLAQERQYFEKLRKIRVKKWNPGTNY